MSSKAYGLLTTADDNEVEREDAIDQRGFPRPQSTRARYCRPGRILRLSLLCISVVFAMVIGSSLYAAVAYLPANTNSKQELIELEKMSDNGQPVVLDAQMLRDEERLLHRASFWHHLGKLFSTLPEHLWNWQGIEHMWKDYKYRGRMLGVVMIASGSNFFVGDILFRYFNFVQGFQIPGFIGFFSWIFGPKEKWRPPVANETIGIVTYQDYAKQHFGKEFPYAFFNDYYTGNRVPSWEDNDRHKTGIGILDAGVSASRKILGQNPVDALRMMEPRVAFDTKALTEVAWNGFSWMGPNDIKFASNGVYGISVVDKLLQEHQTTDALGVLMTDSVFSAHLRHTNGEFTLDLSSLEKYTPIPGYAPLGGKAVFKEKNGRLQTMSLEYNNTRYFNFDDKVSALDFAKSKLSGWRFAEKAIIASLLSMTNLVMHVKDLHLEIAAAFQAISVDAFAVDPQHPVRRLLDPFISRSVQATNDNFKLLFEYHAAEFSLAPLPWEEQLRLIDDAIKSTPLNLAEMDMENFGKVRNMPETLSSAGAQIDKGTWGWRWHYRALTVQRLYDQMISCWLEAHYGGDTVDALDKNIAADDTLSLWWTFMLDHIPSLRTATQRTPTWASAEVLTGESLKNVLRTLMVWLSWIHEDVGHSAAAYVYNPVHTPMCVPKDGVGIPLASWSFNVLAYRGFVFLQRAVLLDKPPEFWFDQKTCEGDFFHRKCREPKDDKKCFLRLQDALRELGENDAAFKECDEHGFYSCVDRVETAVSS